MTTPTVYYNFPEINLNLTGTNCSKRIDLPLIGQQQFTNIQLNNVNYSARYFYVTGSNTTATDPTYFVVECLSDLYDNNSNKIFVVFPLRVNAKDKSDIDNIIDASGETVISLKLNNYIGKDGRCVVSSSPTFPLTITLDSKSEIHIQQYIKTCYTLDAIHGLSVDSNPTANSNAALMQQDLDWIMSCELLTEDGPNEKKQIDPDSTATTISLFMMAILIAGSTYIFGPILYNEFGMYRLATEVLKDNHYSIKVYWGVNIISIALLCVVHGIMFNNSIYFFIAISLILSYFSGTSAMSKVEGIGNAEKTDIKYDPSQKIFAVFYQIFWGECSTSLGRALRVIFLLLLIYSLLGMIGSMSMGSNILFASHLIFYFIMATILLRVILYTNAIKV